MATPAPEFAVVTSSGVEAGLVLNYLLKTTSIRIKRVYVEGAGEPSKRTVSKPAPLLDRLNWHVSLAARIPRVYRWRAVSRLTGWSHLDALSKVERLHQGLFDWLCPEARDPERAPVGRLLVPLAEVAREHQIEIVETPNINRPESVESLRALGPDVIIGLGTRILSPGVLATAKRGVLNGHSAILPAYRGSVAEFWQLVGGERETGVTIHWMAPRVDSGAICAIRRWPIPEGADHFSLRLRSLFYRLPLWQKVVGDLLLGIEHRIEQGPSPTRTFLRPTQKELFDFYCRQANRRL